MTAVLGPYGQSLALLTDLYELTMAYGYWKSGMAERESVFHLYFRTNEPFRRFENAIQSSRDFVVARFGLHIDFLRGFRLVRLGFFRRFSWRLLRECKRSQP